jgi:hypothetical protein
MLNKLRIVLLLVILPVGVSLAQEEEKPYRSLVENSPFLTPAFKARLGRHKSVSLNLKFTGYTKLEGTWYFALLDVKSGKNYWMQEKVEQDGILVESFQRAKEIVHLKVGDIAFELKLEQL